MRCWFTSGRGAALAADSRGHSGCGLAHIGLRHAISIGPRVHVVQRGETLWRLSRRYETDVQTLMRLNGLRNAQQLRAGQSLKVPRKETDRGPTVGRKSSRAHQSRGPVDPRMAIAW